MPKYTMKHYDKYLAYTIVHSIYYWQYKPVNILPDVPFLVLFPNNHVITTNPLNQHTNMYAYVNSDWAGCLTN